MDSTWMATANDETETAFRRRVLSKNPGLKDDPDALAAKVSEEAPTNSQTCVSDKTARDSIVYLFMQHLHWHPITHLQQVPFSPENYKMTIWKIQVEEMHRLCKELRESWAWEYLWENWYSPFLVQMFIYRYNPSRWRIWARAMSPYLPIIQSNAVVESFWGVLKRIHTRRMNRPKLELLVEVIMDRHLDQLLKLIQQHRDLKNPIKPTW